MGPKTRRQCSGKAVLAVAVLAAVAAVMAGCPDTSSNPLIEKPVMNDPGVSSVGAMGQATLTWGRVPDADRYVVERRTKGDTAWTEVGATADGQTITFVDTVAPGETYDYRVIAVRTLTFGGDARNPSDPQTVKVILKANNARFDPGAGTYHEVQTVTLDTSTEEAVFIYTTVRVLEDGVPKAEYRTASMAIPVQTAPVPSGKNPPIRLAQKPRRLRPHLPPDRSCDRPPDEPPAASPAGGPPPSQPSHRC